MGPGLGVLEVMLRVPALLGVSSCVDSRETVERVPDFVFDPESVQELRKRLGAHDTLAGASVEDVGCEWIEVGVPLGFFVGVGGRNIGSATAGLRDLRPSTRPALPRPFVYCLLPRPRGLPGRRW